MKKIMCIMLMFCFCLVGFTVGRRSMDVYLNDNEGIFISRHNNQVYVWVYILDQDTYTWEVEDVKSIEYALPRVNIHFVEPLVFEGLE